MKGTVKELVAQGVKVNGVALDQAQLSVLTRLGLANKVGTVARPEGTKGKPASIWELTPTATLSFSV